MKEIRSPEKYEKSMGGTTMALLGGISNCIDWQSAVSSALSETELILLNPRRKFFDVHDIQMERAQIEWEHEHILLANAYVFWFCEETLCPITLFEFGKVLGLFRKKKLFVGTHLNYQRRRDVCIQLDLMRPQIMVVNHLDELIQQIRKWAKKSQNLS